MLNELINNKIKPLHFDTPISDAINLCEKYQINYFPIVNDSQLVGMISLDDLTDFRQLKTIEDLKEHLNSFFIIESSSLVDSLKYFNTFSSNCVPVVSNNNEYLGIIFLDDVLSKLASFPFFYESGLVLLLEIQTKKYAVSEIAKIVESNNCRLFGTMLVELNESNVVVLVKLSTNDSPSVISSLERFGYKIIGKYFTEYREDLFKNRYEHLMHYLEI